MTADSGEDSFLKPLFPVHLPDPPEEARDGMVNDHLSRNGNARYLAIHLGDAPDLLTGNFRYISPVVTNDATGLHHPDFFIAFNADYEDYRRRNGYVISEQGKPPDFVLEIASSYSGGLDDTVKRDFYEDLGVPEYWRFDPTGEYNEALLAADHLMDGKYQPITVHRLGDEIWQGYSIVLNLYIRWERGELRWIDPTTMRHILTYEDMRDRADAARARADAERARADAARARIGELEEEKQRLRKE